MKKKVIKHLRERAYMSGVERDRARVKATGEVFTPTPLVRDILDKLPEEAFKDPTKTYLDPTCGDGQFLSEVIIRKMEYGSTYEQALATTYGADMMEDNCIQCIKRLYGVNGEPVIEKITPSRMPKRYKRDGLKAIFKVNGEYCNIVQADGLVYDYSFGVAETVTKNAPASVQCLFAFDE